MNCMELCVFVGTQSDGPARVIVCLVLIVFFKRHCIACQLREMHLQKFNVWWKIYYAPQKISGEHIVAGLSVHPSVRPIRVRPITLLFEVGF